MSGMFFIFVVKVAHKSDKLGSYRHVFSVAKVILTRRRIFKMYHSVTSWKMKNKTMLYNIFDNQ